MPIVNLGITTEPTIGSVPCQVLTSGTRVPEGSRTVGGAKPIGIFVGEEFTSQHVRGVSSRGIGQDLIRSKRLSGFGTNRTFIKTFIEVDSITLRFLKRRHSRSIDELQHQLIVSRKIHGCQQLTCF